VPLTHSAYFRVLTCPSCVLQEVSAPLSLSLFLGPDMPLRALQEVSAPHSLGLFLCSVMPVLLSPGSECPSLAQFISVS